MIHFISRVFKITLLRIIMKLKLQRKTKNNLFIVVESLPLPPSSYIQFFNILISREKNPHFFRVFLCITKTFLHKQPPSLL